MYFFVNPYTSLFNFIVAQSRGFDHTIFNKFFAMWRSFLGGQFSYGKVHYPVNHLCKESGNTEYQILKGRLAMRKHVKTIEGIILTLCMVVGMMSGIAYAEGIGSNHLTMRNTHAIAMDGSGDGWSYDSSTQTLTLDNFDGEAIYFEDGDATIVLAEGSINTVELVRDIALSLYIGGNLTIKGSGVLILNACNSKTERPAVSVYSVGKIVLEDSLVMNGGISEGDAEKLSTTGRNRWDDAGAYTSSGEKARYVVIAPEGTVSSPVDGIKFDDVAPSAYYADAVSWAIDRGITNGTSMTTFSPDATCTQAQIITFLYRAMGTPVVSINNMYTNGSISSDKYYYDAMLWAYQEGVVTNVGIDPESGCSRCDVVTYLWRLDGEPDVGGYSFTDVSDSASYARAVAWAVSTGITSGTSATTFSPDIICTRGQIVTFLYRAQS